GQKTGGLHHVAQRAAAGGQHTLHVLQRLPRLGGDACRDGTIGGMDRQLAGKEYQVAMPDGLAIGPDSGGGLFTCYDLFHRFMFVFSSFNLVKAIPDTPPLVTVKPVTRPRRSRVKAISLKIQLGPLNRIVL